MKTIVAADGAPQAIGPYSQAVKANGFLFLSGQIALDPVTGQIVYGGVGMQTRQVFSNLRVILQKEGLDFSHVVKATVYLQDLEDFAAMNQIYGEFFPTDPPARACVQVARLPRDVSIEIEMIAVY